jgi:hypothetical protein
MLLPDQGLDDLGLRQLLPADEGLEHPPDLDPEDMANESVP